MADVPEKRADELFGDGTPPRSTRDKLIYIAINLFYAHGFHAVGIDQIIAQVGVTKTTFYNHFECKEDLVVAAIQLRDKWEMDAFSRQLQERAGYDPKAMLIMMFDVLDEWFNDPDYNGCIFLNACSEFPSPHDPVHKAASNHYLVTGQAIEQMARAAGVEDAESFSREMVMLLQGTIMYRQVSQDDEAAKIAKRMAENRLAQYLQTS